MFIGLNNAITGLTQDQLSKTINSLFSKNEQGVWYDPSDLSTMYQDAAGTTPVTAVEQAVGLILDKSKGLVLGPELIPNGDFSSSTGWGLDRGVSISSGVCTFTNVGDSYSGVVRRGLLTAGKRYRLTVDVLSISGGALVGFFAGNSSPHITTSGVYTFDVTAESTTTNFGIICRVGTVNAVIDNISVKEVLGNHATQATTASRPLLSARVNLLTKTEQFDDAIWRKFTTGSSTVLVTDNFGIAPDGNQTATRLQMTGSGGFAEIFQRLLVNIGVQYTVSVWMRSLSGTKQTTIFGPAPYSSLVTVTEQWQRFSFTASAIKPELGIDILANTLGASASLDILIWHPDLRVANVGTNLPAYQRVNTATDYDTVGFPHYLLFDGVDDFLQTNSIDFSGTDKMTVFAGVRKLSDAARGMIVEFGNVQLNSFRLNSSISNATVGAAYRFDTAGSIEAFSSTNTIYPAPITNTLTGIGAISGDLATLRVNGTQATSSTTDQGTGNYGNYPLYIGRRGGTSYPFNGQLYGLVIRGALSSTGEIQGSEAYMNLHTGAY